MKVGAVEGPWVVVSGVPSRVVMGMTRSMYLLPTALLVTTSEPQSKTAPANMTLALRALA